METPILDFLQRQIQHGFQTLAGALGGKASAACAEEGGGIPFAFRDDAACFIERICACDLGDVPAFAAEGASPFVTGHVEADKVPFPLAPQKINNGGFHPCCATFIMMAHSMRLRKSSQPFS